VLWVVPFLFVVVYVLVVVVYFHDQARWTDDRLTGITLLLLGITAAFSLVWYSVAYGASLLLGEYGTVGVLLLISKIPGITRHVVVTPPARAETPERSGGDSASCC
jgi:hypothetical protein